jgi:hypothetical protein
VCFPGEVSDGHGVRKILRQIRMVISPWGSWISRAEKTPTAMQRCSTERDRVLWAAQRRLAASSLVELKHEGELSN